MAEQDDLQGLVIIKRRSYADPEQPKGGVWKIAFADFMTAMMCFFLVMWLINAANEDTRQAVAAYFNPVRLAELNLKGLENPHLPPKDQPKEGERTEDESTPGTAPTGEPQAHRSREALFSDPYKVLAEISANASEGSPPADVALAPGLAGATFRDPFDPDNSDQQPGALPAPVDIVQAALRGTVASSGEPSKDSEGGGRDLSISVAEELRGGLALPEAAPMSLPTEVAAAPPIAAPDRASLPPPAGGSAAPDLGKEVTKAVREETRSDRAPNVAVEETGEGLLISLTDDVDFGMFAIGSAEPQPEMVRVMERIGAILQTRGGSITIRGHTDARPFRGGNYDNWRLSTDRAQMAYYMLVRGGLDEKRVEAIEGFADRKLKSATDPDAAENRRIEILVREAAT